MAEVNDTELLRKYNLLYLEIIMRYKDYIEENENVNVSQLPNLVTPEDEGVVGAANKIKSMFTSYTFEQNFHDAAKQAYGYVKEDISNISPPIDFWLTPSQVIKTGAGDIFDKAVLLCSMLIALGNVSTRIVIFVRQTERKFIVYSETEGKIIAFDMEGGMQEFTSKEKLLERFEIKTGEDTTAYEFNDKMYNDLA